MNSELLYQIAFSRLKGVKLDTGRILLEPIGSERDFFDASESDLRAAFGNNNTIFSSSVRLKALDDADRELKYLSTQNIRAIHFSDNDYPKRLLNCDDAPTMLYATGACDFNADHIISIVGTRHATAYGVAFVNDVIASLAAQIDNILVVSGLAYGIDIAAHRASLAQNVPTAAVLAHGLSTIYPSQHRSDAAKMIANSGAVITEYLHDDPIHRGNFLARNRIVAGMCDCLLVAESAEKGGALVTAKIASAYSRDVMALPGRTSDSYSRGCNALIAKNIAALVQSPDDIIDAMGWHRRPKPGTQQSLPLDFSTDEQSVINYLADKGDSRPNNISIDLQIPIHHLLPILVELEFKGAVLSFPGGHYRLA